VTAYSAARPPSTNTIARPPYPRCVLRFCNSVTSLPVSSVSDTAAETAIDGDPKSRAGARTVAFPADIVSELADHLERFADPTPNGFVFIGPKGGRLRRSNFAEVWYRARGAVGLPELYFHDLGHTGNTMAAAQGASLKELMVRMGHSSPRAALIYTCTRPASATRNHLPGLGGTAEKIAELGQRLSREQGSSPLSCPA
jgi:hypothetical protein